MRILLMAGGGGTRLWPLSTEARPKQFLPAAVGPEPSRRDPCAGPAALARRLGRHLGTPRPSRRRRASGRAGRPRILAEPVRRNSGPAILAAAVRFSADGDPITATIPTDQTVRDDEAFRRALSAAEEEADGAAVVILAVPPSRPETDFGYIEVRDGAVLRFVEKPDRDNARMLAASGRHLWNAGIFVFRPSRLLDEARRVAGALLAGVERFVGERRPADYASLPDISFDFAVMEKAAGRARRAARRGLERRRDLALGPRPARRDAGRQPRPVGRPGARAGGARHRHRVRQGGPPRDAVRVAKRSCGRPSPD